jgi:WD40 repeat protein
VLLIDTQTGQTLRTLDSGSQTLKFNGVGLIKFNADGSKIVLGSLGLARLWDTQTGKLIAELSSPREGMYIEGDAEFGLNDKRVAFVVEHTVRLHDAETGDQLAELVVDNRQPEARFSPDGTRLIVTHHNVIQAWDAQSGKRLLEWNTPDELDQWQFSPDGSILITATHAGITQLWDPTTGQLLIELKGHHAKLWSIVFSPDRSLLATSSDDDTIRLWGLAQP